MPGAAAQAQQKFGEAVANRDLDAFDQLVAPDSVDHDGAPGQVAGPEGYKMFFGQMLEAFPDLQLSVETMVEDPDGERVAFAYTIAGTNTGPFQGNDPTGQRMSVRGLQISRIVDGKLVERWGATDELSIMQQLGLS